MPYAKDLILNIRLTCINFPRRASVSDESNSFLTLPPDVFSQIVVSNSNRLFDYHRLSHPQSGPGAIKLFNINKLVRFRLYAPATKTSEVGFT